ncbi:hypothetical protein VTK56DRAFT_5287 [Thermocarpiscus australiensis]
MLKRLEPVRSLNITPCLDALNSTTAFHHAAAAPHRDPLRHPPRRSRAGEVGDSEIVHEVRSTNYRIARQVEYHAFKDLAGRVFLERQLINDTVVGIYHLVCVFKLHGLGQRGQGRDRLASIHREASHTTCRCCTIQSGFFLNVVHNWAGM